MPPEICEGDQALPCKHDWPSPLQWERDRRFRNQQRCEAGLCSSSSPFQHLLHLYAVPRRSRPGDGDLHPVPAGRLPL